VALRKIIAQRLGDRTLNIDHVASVCDVHKRTLQRALEVHGLTFKSILDDIRQETAKKALRETEESIRAIARSLGYSEPSNFARSFKRWTGLSPAAFRSMQRLRCGKCTSDH
jgi:AraC-like DNA-binding protein